MSRSLQIAHIPVLRPVLRFSGYVTDPSITDAMLQDRMRCFDGLTLWRSSRNLPADWPVRDDSMITSPPPVVPAAQRVWGQGAYVCVDSYLGEAQTPDMLLVGVGKLVIERVWLFDANAEPWPAAVQPCPPPLSCPECPPCVVAPCAPETSAFKSALVGALLGAGGVGAVWWLAARPRALVTYTER
jgi:hypothetical protein